MLAVDPVKLTAMQTNNNVTSASAADGFSTSPYRASVVSSRLMTNRHAPACHVTSLQHSNVFCTLLSYSVWDKTNILRPKSAPNSPTYSRG